MKSNSAWLSRDTWVCRNHLPVVRYRAGTQGCWYHGCESVRPVEKLRPAAPPEEPVVAAPPPPAPEPEQPDVEQCAWKDCDKAARPGSKYCSRNCSNKNARYRHRLRKRDEDEGSEANA